MDDNQEPPKSGQLSTYSAPVTEQDATSELLACLLLVAPSNLTAEDRAAWIAVARQTVAGMPADQFHAGCQRARELCRFPSEIIPTIFGNLPEGKKSSRYISESGFIYHGDEDEVMRVAAQRADWTTYWFAKSQKAKTQIAKLDS